MKIAVRLDDITPDMDWERFLAVKKLLDRYGIKPLIGVIPDDENVVVAANQGESLTGYHTPAGKAYENICRRIMGEDVPLACYPRRKSFFFRVADYLIHR